MWNQPMAPEINALITLTLARNTAMRMSKTAVREELLLLIAKADIKSLVLYNVPQYGCLDIMDTLYLRQTVAFFQKNASFDIGIDREQVAREKWYDTERVCRETNTRFRPFAGRPDLNDLDNRVASVLYAAQQKIAKVLGERVPKLKDLELVFGPGATQGVKKKDACSRVKLSAPPSCSANLVPLLPELFSTWPLYAEFHGIEEDTGEPDYVVVKVDVEIADGRLGFAPKNAKTYRTVILGPLLNGVVQGGYGRYIARRLLRVGIDLSDQTINKRLAREGSLTGELATLDLSSASDLIATELVAHLLPLEWYLALNSCRTTHVIDGTSRVTLEKYSSMGDGFTFPLQSLIFWALSTACQETFADARKVSVYGDDIIVPAQSVPRVIEVFQYCGFEINTLKSYWEGPFRESCGGDYYRGVNIRPIYLKDTLSYKNLFAMHNYFVRGGMDDLAALVLPFIPETLRIMGPDGYGDGHLLGDWLPRSHKRDQGWSGWLFDTFKEFGKKHKKLLPGDYLLPAYTTYVAQPEQWERFPYGDAFPLRPGEHVECSCSVPKSNAGVPHLDLPGVVGFKRVTLYTLSR